MHILKSHDIVRYTLCVCLVLSCFHVYSQCPFTQSIELSLESNGQAYAQAIDFIVDPTAISSTALNREVYGCMNVGIQEIKVDIVDQNNQPHSCKEFIVISDPTGNCSDSPQLPKAILGKVVTPIGHPIQGVTVSISNATTSVFRGTNEDGLYLFNDIPQSQYLLEPSKNNDLKNGVTTQDIILLQKHLIKIKTFDSPFQYIAADVNNSGDITAYDMILLRQAILNSISLFPDNTSWKFVRIDHQFSNRSEPLRETLTKQYAIDYAPSLSMNNNFIGIKIGDLNNSVYANMTMVPREDKSFEFATPNQAYKQNDLLTLPFRSEQEGTIEGYQLAIDLNPNSLELVSVEGLEESAYHIKDNQLFISQVAAKGVFIPKGETLFSLTVQAKDKGLLKNNINFENRDFSNELYTVEGMIPIRMEFSNDLLSNIAGDIFPNPFTTTPTLPLNLAKANDVHIKVYTLQGQTIWEQTQFINEGDYLLPITAPFVDDGIYFYDLSIGGEQFSGKMRCNK